MTDIKLWESNFKDTYIVFTTAEEYFKYLTDNNFRMNFSIKSKYTLGNDPKCRFDTMAMNQGINLIYTDSEHPILAPKENVFYDVYVNPNFFAEHKAEFIAYYKNYLKSLDKSTIYSITIPDFALDDNELFELINDDDLSEITFRYIMIEGKKITDEQIEMIKKNHLEFTIYFDDQYENISTNKVLDGKTIKYLKNIDKLYLTLPIKEEEIENFSYINPNAIIKLSADSTSLKNEEKFFEEIKNIFNVLKRHERNYNIQFEIVNNEIFRKSNLLNTIPSNINIIFDNDLQSIDIETYKSMNDKLENLIAPIRDSQLSPFEKYIAVYNIVKKFKKYKENKENKNESRYLIYLLDNEYIVCRGFAKLLEELLTRVGIPCKEISATVDLSYDKGFTMDETTLEYGGHSRNMIKIDDDKYGIHGIYIADATWDNYMDSDIYLNSLMTFDRKKEAKRLETLGYIDLLFDFHDIDDFSKKTKHYLQRERDSKWNLEKEPNKKIRHACKDYFRNILDVLMEIDYKQYRHFYEKYYEKIMLSINLNDEQFAIVFDKMLAEYAKYVIPLSNNEVNISLIFKAATEVKRKIDGLSDEEIIKWLEKIKNDNMQVERSAFPYKYDKDNPTEAYLDDAEFTDEDTKTK